MDGPRTNAGRVALIAGAVSLVALAAYAGVLAVMGEDGVRPGFPVLLLALVSGLVATAAVVKAVAFGRERSKVAIGCLGVAGVLFLGLVVFVIGDIAAGVGPRYLTVEVSMPRTPLDPHLAYSRAAKGDSRITLRVINTSSAPVRFGLVQMIDEAGTGQAFTGEGGRGLPQDGGQVRAWTSPGEPRLVFWATGRPVEAPVVAESAAPPARPPGLSREIAPGATVSFTLSRHLPPHSIFFVYSDAPGEFTATVNGFETR